MMKNEDNQDKKYEIKQMSFIGPGSHREKGGIKTKREKSKGTGAI